MSLHRRRSFYCRIFSLFTFLFLLKLSPTCFSQSVIYSMSNCGPSEPEAHTHPEGEDDPEHQSARIVQQTVTSSFQPSRANTTQVSTNSADLRIHVRSKRNMQRMPRPAESGPTNEFSDAQRALLKESSKNISLVLAALLDNYDHNQRPGYGGPPAVITTNLEIRSMGPISELDMEYSLDCYFRQKWQDERLQYNSTTAPHLSLNIKMLDKIWKPDTYFHTGKGSHLHMITTPNKFLRIYKNGGILYSMRLTIKSLCPMDLHSFPMDKQSCPLILGSYGYPSDQLVYKWDSNPVTFNSRDFTLSQYDIVKTITRNGTQVFKRGEHSMLQVNFNLRRHVGYFLIQIYVPCSLIVVLSWVSFWINREATADRVGLGATSVLTLSTFGIDSRRDLPRVSYPTALDWYTQMCFLFVVSTLLEFAGVHYFTKVGTGEVPIIELDEDDDEDEVGELEGFDRRSTNGQVMRRDCRDALSRKHVDKWRSKVRYRHATKLYPSDRLRVQRRKSSHFLQNQQLQQQQHQQFQQVPKLSSNEQIWSIETPMMMMERFGDGCPTTVASAGVTRREMHAPSCPKSAQYGGGDRFPSNGLGAMGAMGAAHQPPRDELSTFLENYIAKNHNTQIHPLSLSTPNLGFYSQPEDGIADESDSDESSMGATEEFRGVVWALADCCVQFWYCFTSNENYRQEMRRRRTVGHSDGVGQPAVNSVSRIDKVSRIFFPLIFTVLNLLYWVFFINERNAEFNQWE